MTYCSVSFRPLNISIHILLQNLLKQLQVDAYMIEINLQLLKICIN
jgi:hypothetical protein